MAPALLESGRKKPLEEGLATNRQQMQEEGLHNGEIIISGQSYEDARSLMYWTEDEPFVATGSQVTIDSATYAALEKDHQDNYSQTISNRGGRLAAIKGDIYVRRIPHS